MVSTACARLPDTAGRIREIVISTTKWHRLLFVAILLIGIFARVWEFDDLPPGLNQDEASSGVDAYSLYHYGVDRNDVSFPVHFVAWGSGQNALYAYALIPAIAVGGLTPFTVRLPMLLSGILSLLLVYWICLRTADREAALLGMFLLAICPWHIMLSRWGLESNFLPFVFLLAYACTLKSEFDNHWFIAACGFLALCLYAYGPAYVEVPLFLAAASALLWKFGRVSVRTMLIGWAAFAVLAAPIVAFIAVNSLGLQSAHLGAVTIPRLPSEARYETLSPVFHSHLLTALYYNFRAVLHMLMQQTDGLPWNSFEPYGYFFKFTFPVAVIGLLLVAFRPPPERRVENWLLLPWVGATILAGMLQPVNINRINMIFIPIVLCTTFALGAAIRRWRPALLIVVGVFTLAFGGFLQAQHGARFRTIANEDYNAGLLSAIDFARQSGSQPVCITDSINMPYVFVLFLEHGNPHEYQKNIDYADAHAPFRQVRHLGRYSFGEHNCASSPAIHVLRTQEAAPPAAAAYRSVAFDNFRVLIPGG